MTAIRHLCAFLLLSVVRENAEYFGVESQESSTPITYSKEKDGTGSFDKMDSLLYYYTFEVRARYSSPKCREYHRAGREEAWVQDKCILDIDESIRLNGVDLNTHELTSSNAYTNAININPGHVDWTTTDPTVKDINFVLNHQRAKLFYSMTTEYPPSSYVSTFLFKKGAWARTENYAVRIKKPVSFKTPVVDWVTSAVYILTDSKIKVCDADITLCAHFVQSRFHVDVVALAISPKRRLLFWITRTRKSWFSLIKYPLDADISQDNSVVLRNDLSRYTTWLTVDAVQDRIYWMVKFGNRTLRIHSTSFDGKGPKTIDFRNSPSDYSFSSFVVLNDTIYWTDANSIWKCSASDLCREPEIYVPVSVPDVTRIKFEIGDLMLDRRNPFSSEITNVCELGKCSHMCMPEPAPSYTCFCEYSDMPLLFNNTLCEDDTLIVTFGKYLFTIGVFQDDAAPPKIRAHTLNINVSTATYYGRPDNRESLILTEVGHQNIFLWTPKSGSLEPIFAGGPGTISSIELDDYSNNLYWIDPTTFTLKLMNLKSGLKVDLVKGNSTYVLHDFTLLTDSGEMVLLFLNNKSSVVIEKSSMSGSLTSREILEEDIETNDVSQLSMYSILSRAYGQRMPFMLDKETNEVNFFLGEEEDLRMPSGQARIDAITSVGLNLTWISKDDLIIHRMSLDDDFEHVVDDHAYPLLSSNVLETVPDIKKNRFNDAAVLRILPVATSYSAFDFVRPYRHFRCLHRNNGGCEEICVRTDDPIRRTTCLCTEGKELINGTKCRHNSSETEGTTTMSSKPGKTTDSTKERKSYFEHHFEMTPQAWVVLVMTLAAIVGFVWYFRTEIRFHLIRIANSLPMGYCSTILDYCCCPLDYCRSPPDYCTNLRNYCRSLWNYCNTFECVRRISRLVRRTGDLLSFSEGGPADGSQG